VDFLAENKTGIIVGIVSGLIVALILWAMGWLRKVPSVPVPTWLVVAIIVCGAVWWWLSSDGEKKLSPVLEKSFRSEFVKLDGKVFIRCKFDRCTLVFSGKRPVGFEHCEFVAPMFRLAGSAAVSIQQIVTMRKDPAFKPVIDKLIEGQVGEFTAEPKSEH